MVRGTDAPGTLDRRYELITQSRTRRLVWYIVRRHLQFSIEEWEALPWYQQLVYLEGIQEEFYQEDDSEPEREEDVSGNWDALAARGIPIRTVQASE